MNTIHDAVPVSLCPFKPDTTFDFDPLKSTWIELSHGTQLYNLVASYVVKNLIPEDVHRSFSVDVCPIKSDESSRTKLELGLGLFSFSDTNNKRLYALHQAIGSPLGLDYSVEWYKNLIIFISELGQQDHLVRFCDDIIKENEKTEIGQYTIFNWHVCHQYWNEESICKARVVESVVLPNKLKDKL
eukprot:CAMPEP_0182427280 /NCGR_PEP_ID=MMETSP1167-20130531/16687_1 /TAXON_ID=2988 /ORGANISM="Mallomonas Sp, Strain CCMP3275" /LENGTH=185 /DNA_ID=CAMNT_0024609407 /DNA_START=108 /DNA_END=662 /DNA_ORIENTATION=-